MSLTQKAVELRKRLPAPIRRWMDAALAAEHGPAQWAKGLAARGVPVPAPLLPREGVERTVLFGPLNYAGQGYCWAESLRTREPRVDARALSVEFPGGFKFPADGVVPAEVFVGSARWRREQRAAIAQYSHLVCESFASLLGRGTGGVITRELAEFSQRGAKVALLCHGSDIRDPRAHAARSEFSPFAVDTPERAALQRTVDANRRVLDTFDGTVFVSTPDLLDDVPDGVWLPVVVNVDLWARTAAEFDAAEFTDGEFTDGEFTDAEPQASGPVRVLHVPSSGPIKGTQWVDEAAEALVRRNLIHYERVTGVPAAEMPHRVAAADIVVDQLLIGSYGVAACEAMAAGRTVVGNVSDSVRAAVKQATGFDLPIVQATPHTLGEVLAGLATSEAARSDAGSRGAEFVRAVHGGDHTPRAMSEFLGLDGQQHPLD